MKSDHTFQIGNESRTVTVNRNEDGVYLKVDDRQCQIDRPQIKEGTISFFVKEQRVRAVVAKKGDSWYVNLEGRQWVLTRPTPARRRSAEGAGGVGSGDMTASMPGQVIEVLASPKDAVEAGQTLVLLEAMKMELRITAPFDGVVESVHCRQGETVDREQLLVTIQQVGE